MCGGLNAGNSQVPYNSPGSYLVHVLFPQLIFFNQRPRAAFRKTPGTLTAIFVDIKKMAFNLQVFRSQL